MNILQLLRLRLFFNDPIFSQELANAQGSILENKALIESLNQTKKNSVVIMDALTESHNLQVRKLWPNLEKRETQFRVGSVLSYNL